MTMFKEILRLFHEGQMSGREIAVSCRCSYTTVKRVQFPQFVRQRKKHDNISSQQTRRANNDKYNASGI